jgi:membrane-associated phospholipid phosphatase
VSRWIILSGIALLAAVLVLHFTGLDAEAARWAAGLHRDHKVVFEFFSTLGDSKYSLVPSGIIALTGYFLKAPRRIVHAALLLFASVALSGIAANIFKFLIGRPRPRLLLQGQEAFSPFTMDWLYHSWPSGHTTTAAAIAVVIALWWRPLGILGAALILAVGSSRVVLGAHYPGDVLAGAWLGVVVSLLLWRLKERQRSCIPWTA